MKKITIQILDTDEAEQAMVRHCMNLQVANALRGGIFSVDRFDESSVRVNRWWVPQGAYKILRNYGKTKSRKS